MSKTIRFAVMLAAVCLLMPVAGRAGSPAAAGARVEAPVPAGAGEAMPGGPVSHPADQCARPAPQPWHPLTACNMISCTPGITNCTQLCGDDAICVAEVGSPAHHCLFH